jgi:glycosyltransferase involved in cell wall biosynthesis
MEVISDIIQQHQNITVINQENQGLSVARNTGITAAKGEYILMPDSDDLLVDNSLKPLLEKALETKVDLVVADFINMTDEEIEQNKDLPLQRKVFDYREKTGKEILLQDLNPYQCYVWHTLFRKEFLIKNNLTFVPGIYIQDVPFTHECYLKAGKCIRTSWLLNIYRKGHESATFSFNKKKAKDFCIAIAKTWELTYLDDLSPIVQNKLKEDVYTSFSAIIWIITHKIDKSSDRIEIFDFLKQQVPNLCFRNGTKQKIVSFMYRRLPHLFIHIRYLYDTICRK